MSVVTWLYEGGAPRLSFSWLGLASVGGVTVAVVGVTGAGKNAAAALSKRPHEHPYAIPPFPAAQGVWLIRQEAAEPLGFVLKRPVLGGYVFDVYAHCRDAGGRRPWLRTCDGFNAAVAWTIQHEPEIRALIAKSTPEPQVWPA